MNVFCVLYIYVYMAFVYIHIMYYLFDPICTYVYMSTSRQV